MKRLALLMTLSLCLLLVSPRTAGAQDDLLGRINNLRASQGLPPYSTNGALAGAAQSQAQWMVNNGCAIAHVHPDGSTPRTRAAAYGYPTVDVSENIYCGTNANTGAAWSFWINSGVHYAGLVNNRYKEVGIASASGAGGTAFVLVFGNPGGPAYVPPSASGSSASGGGGQPSYVLGTDERGNILHEIQDGDTLGDIMLIYGYTWAEIPGVLAMNGLTEADIRDLEIGAVLLIPPAAGTYTPTPGDPPTSTPPAESVALEVTATLDPNQPTPTHVDDLGFFVPSATPTPTQQHVLGATLDTLPEGVALLLTEPPEATPEATTAADASMATVQSVAMNPATAGVVTRSGGSPWLAIALLVQVGVLLAAGFEFLRRKRRP